MAKKNTTERRAAPRAPINLGISWEGYIGPRRGTISDVSTNGCFVLCSGEVLDGQRVKISIKLPKGKAVHLWGEVVNHVDDIGFAVRFVNTGESEKKFLSKLVDRAFKEQIKSEIET
jgi:hypothetical protein